MILLEPENPKSWEAVQESMVEDLSVAVHLTIDADNRMDVLEIIKRLASMGVNKVSLSAAGSEMEPALEAARSQAAFSGQELVWNLPVPFSEHNPVSLETAPRAKNKPAGRAWIYVEPDGDVLPEQGSEQVLGNLLNDPWEKIWKAV
jgi:sulfatase maturation enzyme AslB (radical SAM superfamily)